MRFVGTTALFRFLLAFQVIQTHAIIFLGTGDPTYNTTAPAGPLANSGWQLQGQWGAFIGTPISPNHFLAATHVGGNVGDSFFLNGVQHVTTARHSDTNSDLTIWQVTPAFQSWAQLYSASDEVGKRLVVFGRGTQRGAEVRVGGPLTPVTKGWLWGTYDAVMRWGENTVSEAIDADGNPHSVLISGAVATGALLRATFDSNGGANEATMSFGDSSGGAFIKDGLVWKLAGLNLAVDGPYNTSAVGTGFFGSIFDEGGLYKGGENKWALTPDLPISQAGAFFITRISARVNWITGIIGNPGAPSSNPVLQFATGLDRTFFDDPDAVFDPANMNIRTRNTNERRFFRLRASQPIEITNLDRDGDDLVLRCRYR